MANPDGCTKIIIARIYDSGIVKTVYARVRETSWKEGWLARAMQITSSTSLREVLGLFVGRRFTLFSIQKGKWSGTLKMNEWRKRVFSVYSGAPKVFHERAIGRHSGKPSLSEVEIIRWDLKTIATPSRSWCRCFAISAYNVRVTPAFVGQRELKGYQYGVVSNSIYKRVFT